MIEINNDVTLTCDAMREVALDGNLSVRGMLLTNEIESFIGTVIEIIDTSILVLDRSGTVWNFRSSDLIRVKG